MDLLWRLVPQNLAVRKARTLLTALGIALGVSVVVATGVLRESATHSLADLFDQAAGRADLAVTNAMAGITGGEGFDAAALARVQAVEGVQAAAPLLQVTTLPSDQLDEWTVSFVFGNFDGALLYGVDPRASQELDHYRLVDGQDLTEGDEDAILLNRRYAEELGLNLGDPIELVAPTGQARFIVTGFLTSDGLARLNLGQVGVTSLTTAQGRFARPNRLDQIDVIGAPGVDTDDLKSRLQTALGAGFHVSRPASKVALIGQIFQATVSSLDIIGVMGLIVGGFLIYNTFAASVAERTREMGLLRALGAERGQILGLVLAEAALLGFLGAGLGVLLGLGMANTMKEITGAVLNSKLTKLVVWPEHIILGLGIGVVLALVSSLAPALRASRVAVVQAIQRRHQADGRASRRLLVAGLVLTIPSLGITIVHAIHPTNVSLELALSVLTGMLFGAGFLLSAAIPFLERATSNLLGLLGIEGQLGGRNLARNAGRAAITAGTLMFGLAYVVIIGGGVTSATETTQDYMDKALGADLWIYAPQPLPPSLAAELENLPQIQLVRLSTSIPTQLVSAAPDQSAIAIIFTALDPQRSRSTDWFFASDGGNQEQAIKELTKGGAVVISGSLRERYGLDVGETIPLQTLQGPTDFLIAGVVFHITASGYSVIGSWDDATRYFGTQGIDFFVLHVAPGADVEATRQRILDQWGVTYNLRIETLEEFRVRSRQLSDSFYAINNATVLVGVVVAALGVINTLLMNVLERRREIGVLRSLGMTHGQVLRLILSESMAMGILGGGMGLVLGAWLSRFAVAGTMALTGLEFNYFFPTQAVVTGAFIALFIPPLAGLWPAWRGAKTNIVEALRSE